RSNSNQKNPIIKQDTKNWHQKTSTPKREKEADKNNNKQKPPNTLLSSQTTHPLGRATSPRQKRVLVVRTIRNPPKWGFPLGAAALFGLGPCRSDESTSYVRENSESNGLIGRVFRLATYLAHAECVSSDLGSNVAAAEFVP